VLGERCRYVESLMMLRAEAEIRGRATNFGSGPPVEAILREELANLLPRRYSVTAGTVSDRRGMTAGDCDVVIYNGEWFPTVKQRPTPDARYQIIPIEGVYATLEVKQTLTIPTLEDAMSKLVPCHRLFRPRSAIGRIAENRTFAKKTDRIGNTLFSGILAARRDPNVSYATLLNRFVELNRSLKRLEVVQCLCILGEACYLWGWRPDGRTPSVASFYGADLTQDLHIVEASPEHGETALGGFYSRLLGHLTQVVLAPTDLPVHYGAGDRIISRESAPVLPADSSWNPVDEHFDVDN
jgi:hypothetical protein